MASGKSHVFRGRAGRPGGRPCEPACRRGRVEEAQQAKPEPVAICRLKRVAADYKDNEEIQKKISAGKKTKSNGKKNACGGPGPAPHTVPPAAPPRRDDVPALDTRTP